MTRKRGLQFEYDQQVTGKEGSTVLEPGLNREFPLVSHKTTQEFTKWHRIRISQN